MERKSQCPGLRRRINQMLDIDLHRWTPVWVRHMRWSLVYTILKIHDPRIQYEPRMKKESIS